MQVYSFINSSDAFQWERNPTSFDRSRVFEYTDDYIIDLFRNSKRQLIDDILKFPVLFSVESPHDVEARVGWIENIDWQYGDPVFKYKFDPEFRPITQQELHDLKWELGLVDFEFYRTHWSIKQSDLLKILRNRGFSIPTAVSIASSAKKGSAETPKDKKLATEPASVFISYSHADSEYLKRLQTHLAPIKKWARLETWDDTKIAVGSKWKTEIETALNNCSAAILLVSADFLASDFISENELPPLLLKAEKNGTRIIPVIVKPCLFTSHPQLKEFQAVNSPDQAIISLNEAGQESTWARVAKTVLDMVQD